MISFSPNSAILVLALLLAGCSESAPAQTDAQAVILQYHFISTETPPVTSTSPEYFRRHMEYLRDNGFTVLPLEDVLDALQAGEPLPDRAAVITFDDGYRSVYTEAYPLLRDYGWPFTVFVTTGLLESNPDLYASWAQVGEMAENGATIANHTVSHPYMLERLENESEQDWLERITAEIVDAEEEIARRTGQNHQLLAYPYGEYDPQIEALVEELGFIGIAQHSGPINASSDFTALPRFPFSGIYVSMNTFPTKVNSLAFTLDDVSPDSPVTDARSPSAVLDFSDDTTSLDQLACYNSGEAIDVTAVDAGEKIYRVETHIENRGRRFRYNCTAPGREGRYYWYSIPWVNPDIPE